MPEHGGARGGVMAGGIVRQLPRVQALVLQKEE